MNLDYALHEVRALRNTVKSCYPCKDREIALTLLNKVMTILWHARYDEFVATDAAFRSILKGENDAPRP